MTSDQLLSDFLPPPPRQVRLTVEADLKIYRFLFLACSMAGLAVVAYLLLLFLWASYGTNTIGQVVSSRVSHGRLTYYYLTFTYRGPDGMKTDEDRVPKSGYDDIQNRGVNGSADVTVRYLAIGPLHYAGLVDFSDLGAKSGWPIAMLLFLGVVAIQIWLTAWVRPARERILASTGIPVLGAITDKRVVEGRRTKIYFIKYAYKDSAGRNRETEAAVTDFEKWQAMEKGQAVTVLVHPTRPKRSLMYELSRYRVDEALR